MDKKVCLDTDACIAIINRRGNYQNLLNKILYSRIFISTVSLFELFLRKTNIDKIEEFREKINLLEFDENSSRKASEIFKYLKSKGQIIEIRDIFIASSCIINNCTLLTLNVKHFSRIKEQGLSLLEN